MRIHFKINTNDNIIPFNHQHLLTGTIHKWFGWNKEHGELSLYSFSQLNGAKVVSKGLKFSKEASFFFSSHDPNLLKKIISNIQSDPTMFYGLSVSEIIIQEDPDFLNRNIFYSASPIFIKRHIGKKVDHILYNDSRADNYLKETLLTKMRKAKLTDETLDIKFDKSYQKAGTKLITYNNIQNKANWCPVFIKGKPETKLFAWNVGLGNSTGIGFGAIK